MPPAGTCIRCGFYPQKRGRKVCEACVHETAQNIVDVGPQEMSGLQQYLRERNAQAEAFKVKQEEARQREVERQRRIQDDIDRQALHIQVAWKIDDLARGILRKLGGTNAAGL